MKTIMIGATIASLIFVYFARRESRLLADGVRLHFEREVLA